MNLPQTIFNVSLLNNLTKNHCDKVEKLKKLKTILVKSWKMRQRFDVRSRHCQDNNEWNENEYKCKIIPRGQE